MMSKLCIVGLALIVSSSGYAADLPVDYGEPSQEATADDRASAGMSTFAACRNAIAQWAEPFSPVDIEMVSIGPVQRKTGQRTAPLYVRIVYETQGGRETRKARVNCTVDANEVVAVQPSP
jgi:hypothetical protein